MNYEKRYKNLVRAIKQLQETNPSDECIQNWVNDTLYGTKENENEKNIKDLIDELKCSLRAANCQNEVCNGGHEKRIALLEWAIAWVEKQDSYYTFEIKKGHWYKCVCDYMLNGSDLMFKNGRLYYCRCDWRLGGEIDERNVKDIGVHGYKSFFRPATNQEIKDWLEKQVEQTISENYKQAEKEKRDVVGRGFMLCNGDILDFKEGESYWLEYIGDDKYNVRSDNLLGKTYHLTPMQFYLCFRPLTWLEKQGEQNLANSAKTCKNEQKSDEWHREDEQNLNACLGYIPDEFLRRWLKDAIYVKYDKPADKIEPKFKVGYWCIDNTDGTIFQIVKVLNNTYTYKTNEGKEYSCTHYSLENEARPWNIKDAKDGDVLAYVTDEDDLWIMIYRSLYEPYEGHVHYHALLVNNKFSDKGTCCICIDNLKPATKEQYDLLFQKMKEAGYIWNDEGKKLMKVAQKFKVGDWIVENGVNGNTVQITKFEEDKGVGIRVWFSNGTGTYIDFLKSYHLWTIADAKEVDVLCYKDEVFLYKHDIKNCTEKDTSFGGMVYYCCYDGKRFIIDSMYSLTEKDKDNIHPATKEQRDLLFSKMHEAGYEWDSINKQLGSLKAEPIGEISGNEGKISPKWTEEDESVLQGIWDEILANKHEAKEYDWKTYDKYLDWLKSIKQRIEE